MRFYDFQSAVAVWGRQHEYGPRLQGCREANSQWKVHRQPAVLLDFSLYVSLLKLMIGVTGS